jgi:hypothetical protein
MLSGSMPRSLRVSLAAGCVALLLALAPAPSHPATTGFVPADSIGSVFVMPGETVLVATERWIAPHAPGVYPLRVHAKTINAFVMVPATAVRHGYLNGYRIGQYPSRPFRGRADYRPPAGFVEVTPENQDLYLTPHLQLGQFVAKQGGGFPRYVVIDERLLVKLELLLDRVHQAGYDVRRFRVLSGYRTPHYNRAIGNVTTYSRHVYGAAADIYIDDHPADGRMDDLNGDGRSDVRDALVLSDLVKRGFAATPDLLGGVSEYPSTAAHGPFVHVDVRGYDARW